MKDSSRTRNSPALALLLFSSISQTSNAFSMVASTGSSRMTQELSERPHFMLHQTSKDNNDGGSDSVLFASEPTAENTATTALFTESAPLSPSSSPAQFGDVVSLKRSSTSPPLLANDEDSVFFPPSSGGTSTSATAVSLGPDQVRRRNLGVAALSVGLAVMNFVWQYLHPLTPIQILFEMEQHSSPITVIGTTNKPTVVDFWAPWCENCKLLAPTLKQIEDEYGKDVNFVMINGDQDSAWPMIEAFGVDAIPHLALVEADGTVDTALIGPVPKQWLERDLQVLKDNAKTLEGSNKVAVVAGSETEPVSSTTSASLQPLPYQMLDAFANRPNERRVVVQKVVQ